MKRERAIVENRRNEILNILDSNSKVRVEELARIFQVSTITIRRDLQLLEEKKKLVRFYGGAVSQDTFEKKDKTVDERTFYRSLIARYAERFIEDGDTILINTSENALEILDYITEKNVTVITNNSGAISRDYGPNINVILSGGEIRRPKAAMVGDYAIRNLQTVFAKKSFIGCSGITPSMGMMTGNANEVSINRLMLNNCTVEKYILADHTKIGKNSSFISCNIDEITNLITDELAPPEIVEEFRENGVKVYQVGRKDFTGEQI